MDNLDKFQDHKIDYTMYKITRTKGNLNFDFKQVNTYAKKMRDDLQREHPDKYEMSVTVKISMGQQSGKMIPTNMNYIYIYHPNVDGDYDEE